MPRSSTRSIATANHDERCVERHRQGCDVQTKRAPEIKADGQGVVFLCQPAECQRFQPQWRRRCGELMLRIPSEPIFEKIRQTGKRRIHLHATPRVRSRRWRCVEEMEGAGM